MNFRIRCLLCIFVLFTHTFSWAYTIAVAGTGLTGLWTAYSISKALEANKLDKKIDIALIGEWNWEDGVQASLQNEITVFSHETSGFGPIGIQPHSGLLWNTDNEVVALVKSGIGKPEASFYTSPNLEEAGQEFLELYVGWHGRHPSGPSSSFERQRALLSFNQYARKLWQIFSEQQNRNSDFDLHLEGAWRIYEDPNHFSNALETVI